LLEFYTLLGGLRVSRWIMFVSYKTEIEAYTGKIDIVASGLCGPGTSRADLRGRKFQTDPRDLQQGDGAPQCLDGRANARARSRCFTTDMDTLDLSSWNFARVGGPMQNASDLAGGDVRLDFGGAIFCWCPVSPGPCLPMIV
jgi:hypothetical protein